MTQKKARDKQKSWCQELILHLTWFNMISPCVVGMSRSNYNTWHAQYLTRFTFAGRRQTLLVSWVFVWFLYVSFLSINTKCDILNGTYLAKLTFFTSKPQLCFIRYIYFNKFLLCMYEHCQQNIYTKLFAYLQLCKCPKRKSFSKFLEIVGAFNQYDTRICDVLFVF